MGTDMTMVIETRSDESEKWQYLDTENLFEKWEIGFDPEFPFMARNYGTFGFLADVRNYSGTPTIKPPRGLPNDISKEALSVFKFEEENVVPKGGSHISLRELQEYNYEQIIEDKRTTETRTYTNPFQIAEVTIQGTSGPKMTLRQFLGRHFFKELELLGTIGPPDRVRLVFWFTH